MFRSYITIVMAVLYTIVTGVPAIILTLFRPGSDLVLWFGRYWARWILHTADVKIETIGIENLDTNRTYIYLCNHQSNLDVLALILSMPTSFRIVAKKFLFYIPIFGQCIWLMGMIPIDRKRRSSAILSLQKAARRISSGTSVIFFPEGTRSTDGKLLPFKKGAFVIAAQAKVPVVPVTVEGSGELLPKGSPLVRPGTIRIHYGRPISTAAHGTTNKEELMSVVRAAMLERLQQKGGRQEARRGRLPATRATSGPA